MVVNNQVELKAVSPHTRGRAAWLGIKLPEDCTEAAAVTAIFNAELPPNLQKLAQRVGLNIQDYSFGAVWPELKGHRANVEADLMANAGWEVGKWLAWQNAIYLIINIGFNNFTNRSTLRLQPLGAPQVHTVKKGKVSHTKGLVIPLSRRTKTVYPFDLIDSSVVTVACIQLY